MQKTRALIVTIFLLSTAILSAQVVSEYIDSLKQLLPEIENSIEKIQILSDLSQEYIYWEDYEHGKHYAYQAIALAKQLETPPANLETPMLLLASSFYEKSNTDSLQLILSEIHSLCTSSGNVDCLIEYYNTKAALYDISTYPDSSLYYYQKALEMSEGDPFWKDLILSNMGVIFSSLKLNKRARDYYRRSYDIAITVDDIYIQGLALLNIAYTFIEEGQLDSASFYLDDALVAAKNSEYNDVIASVHCYMGLTHLKKQNLPAADSFLHLALDSYTKIGLDREVAETLPYLAQLYYEQGLYDKAEATALQSVQMIQDTESQIYLLSAFQTLANISRLNKDYQLSDAYMQSYQQLQDTIQQQTLLKQFSTLEMDYQLAKKEAKIQLINTKRENEKRAQKFAKMGTLGLLSLLSVVIYLLFRQSTRRRHQNQWLEAQVKARTAELNKSNEELKNYVEEMRTFTHITSHDLKEPLRNISSFTSLLERRLEHPLSPEAIDFMAQIKSNAYQMHRLIEGILYYSTLDLQENKKATLETVNLNHLVDDVKRILSTTIQEKHALIHSSNDLPTIKSSPEALQVVLKNLVENGIKYNRSKQPEVSITYETHTDKHHIIIQDNGIGIEPQYQQQVFQMFKRLHNQEEFKGTGMGLAICRKLLRRLGGDITLKSEAGEGTLFKVILPLSPDQNTAPPLLSTSFDEID